MNAFSTLTKTVVLFAVERSIELEKVLVYSNKSKKYDKFWQKNKKKKLRILCI